jgi:hypothetical protein
MDDFYRLFHINSQHRILIYTNCQYAVIPTQIDKHLRAHHLRLSLQPRRTIASRVEELTGLGTKRTKRKATPIDEETVDRPQKRRSFPNHLDTNPTNDYSVVV